MSVVAVETQKSVLATTHGVIGDWIAAIKFNVVCSPGPA